MLQTRIPHMLFVSQKVIDIKTPKNYHQVAQVIGTLREYLHIHSFIPSDKFTGELLISKICPDGNVEFELAGSSLGGGPKGMKPSIQLILPMDIKNYTDEKTVQNIFSTVQNTSVDDGGNIQNMLLNTIVLAQALSLKHNEFSKSNLFISVASSSDPFQRIDKQLVNNFRERITLYKMELEDRYAIFLPYEHAGVDGTLEITSEPKLTGPFLLNLLESDKQFTTAFRSATCFLASDPFFDILPHYGIAPYAYIINASTAFRAMVAVTAYGNNSLLPMNDGEAGEVCKLMLSRARGTELSDTETPRFPSPLTLKEDSIDTESLSILDSSIDKFTRYNPLFQKAEGISFACPISFGHQGGLIIGKNRTTIACFSSILTKICEEKLFNEYNLPFSKDINEPGAGDSVAAIIALFNTVSPEKIIEAYLEGKELENIDLKHLSCTIFISCLSRIIGNILIRTTKTSLIDCINSKLDELIEDVAINSIELARSLVKLLPNPCFGIIKKWDIRVVVWVPRQLFMPSTLPIKINT